MNKVIEALCVLIGKEDEDYLVMETDTDWWTLYLYCHQN